MALRLEAKNAENHLLALSGVLLVGDATEVTTIDRDFGVVLSESRTAADEICTCWYLRGIDEQLQVLHLPDHFRSDCAG